MMKRSKRKRKDIKTISSKDTYVHPGTMEIKGLETSTDKKNINISPNQSLLAAMKRNREENSELAKNPRPVILGDFGSKVPANVRQKFLDEFMDEYLKFCCSEDEAFKWALEEENKIYDSSSSRTLYLNVAANRLNRLRSLAEERPKFYGNNNVSPIYSYNKKTVSHQAALYRPLAEQRSFSIGKQNEDKESITVPAMNVPLGGNKKKLKPTFYPHSTKGLETSTDKKNINISPNQSLLAAMKRNRKENSELMTARSQQIGAGKRKIDDIYMPKKKVCTQRINTVTTASNTKEKLNVPTDHLQPVLRLAEQLAIACKFGKSQCVQVSLVNACGGVIFNKMLPSIIRKKSSARNKTEMNILSMIQGKIVIGYEVHQVLEKLQMSHPPNLIRDISTYKSFIKMCQQNPPPISELANEILGCKEINLQKTEKFETSNQLQRIAVGHSRSALGDEKMEKNLQVLKMMVTKKERAMQKPIENAMMLFRNEANQKSTPGRLRRIILDASNIAMCLILDLAVIWDGIVVSNDYYRDLLLVEKSYIDVITKRVLMYVFAEDTFMVPRDPLGKNGPHLDEFLSFPTAEGENTQEHKQF